MPNEEIGDSGDFDDGREFVLQFESEKLDEEGDPYRWNHGPFSWSAVRDEYLTWLSDSKKVNQRKTHKFKVWIADRHGKKVTL